MPTATLTVPAAPEQARTARLVAGAAARRAGVDPDLLDDVRLAAAEAVARAVLRSLADPADGAEATVSVVLTDDGDRFEIAVTDRVAGAVEDPEDELALSVMQALAADSRVEATADGGRVVVLSWPTQG